jgi:hypothetical protein
LAEEAQTLGWRINFYVRTVEQFKRQKRERDRFLPALLSTPPLFIIGDDRSFSELVQNAEREYSLVRERNGREV